LPGGSKVGVTMETKIEKKKRKETFFIVVVIAEYAFLQIVPVSKK